MAFTLSQVELCCRTSEFLLCWKDKPQTKLDGNLQKFNLKYYWNHFNMLTNFWNKPSKFMSIFNLCACSMSPSLHKVQLYVPNASCRWGILAITVVGFFTARFHGDILLQGSLTGEAMPLLALCMFSTLVKYMTATWGKLLAFHS